MKDHTKFLVQGSASDPYTVSFYKSGDNLTAICTCPAGENGQYCKHRFSIMEGKTKGIVSPNSDEVTLVQAWLVGTDVEAALAIVSEAEAVVAEAKKRLSMAKKDLARAMYN